jgi:RHS repeat-associated protein
LDAGNGGDIEMKKNGYLYVFVSNESRSDVYFDDIRIDHSRGALIEETHYYPFGLTMAGISSKAAGKLENRFEFNGKEKQAEEFSDASGLELYDFGFRTQDPQTGRFLQLDPHAEKYLNYSPYSFTLNNPVNAADPDGRDVIFRIIRNSDGFIVSVDLISTIYLTGEAADQKMADELNKQVKESLNKRTTENGVEINFAVNYVYSKDMTEEKLGKGENLLTVLNGTERSEVETIGVKFKMDDGSTVIRHLNGRTGIVYKGSGKQDERSPAMAALHESLHFLGLSDRYTDQGADVGFYNSAMLPTSFRVGDTHYRDYALYFKKYAAENPKSNGGELKYRVDIDTNGNKSAPSQADLEFDKKYDGAREKIRAASQNKK